jgi:hypothetical protein
MDRPKRVSGWCPHYDAPSGRCYLTEQSEPTSTQNYHCKSESNCETCGNYEAWAAGRNYTGK